MPHWAEIPLARAATTTGGATTLRFHLRQPQPGPAASAKGCSCKAGHPPRSGGGHRLRDSCPRSRLALTSSTLAPPSAVPDRRRSSQNRFAAAPTAAVPVTGRSSPPRSAYMQPRMADPLSDRSSFNMQLQSRPWPPWSGLSTTSCCKDTCPEADARMKPWTMAMSRNTKRDRGRLL